MADVKISALPAASTPLAGTEVLPIVQGGTTDKVSVADLTAGRTVAASAVVVGAGTVSAPSVTFSGDTNTGIYSPAADTIAFTEGGVESMRIDASGNVGIGTSSPNGRLSVNLGDASGNVSAWDSTYATFGAAGSTTGKAVGIGFNATSNYGEIRSVEPGAAWRDLYIRGNNLNFYPSIAGSSVLGMVLNTSGNVGIGTSSPVDRLSLSGGSVAVYQRWQNTTTGTGASDGYQLGIDSSGQAFVWQYESQPLIFGTNNTERVRVAATGELLVGTTTVYADGTIGAPALQWTALSGVRAGAASRSDTTSSIIAIAFVNPNGVVGSISTSGSGTAYTTSSDYRLKHDVAPLTGGLATIGALKPSTYKWNADDSYGEGFLAHELAEHIPQAVIGDKDAVNEDGSVNPQGVDYSKVVVHLVAAVQELKAENDALKARIATLEAR